MIFETKCQCGERLALYVTPGASTRCWKCRRRVRIAGDDYEWSFRQEFDMTVTGSAPGYTGYVVM